MNNILAEEKKIVYINPLDLIVFKGNDLVSKSIQVMEKLALGNGDWSHVGIVVTKSLLPYISNLEDNKLYIWESTMSGNLADGIKDIHGRSFFGSQIRDLEKVIKGYTSNKKCKVGWAKLIQNPFEHDKEKTIKVVGEVYNKYINVEYEKCFCNLFSAVIPCLRCSRCCSDNYVFCSELVARIYIELGIISKDINPESVTPMDLLGYDKDGIKKFLDNPINLVSK